jgi:uncharacterized protein DUF4491
MQFAGVAIGLGTVILIGFGHVWVKWLLRYFGARTTPLVVVLGIALIGASLVISDWFASALLGIAGFTTVWGAREILQHRKEYEFRRN